MPVQSFRLSSEAIIALDELTDKFNTASLLPLSKSQILEILIFSADQKTPSEILAMLQRKIKD